MTKQLTGKRDDTPLHSAARSGNLATFKEALSGKCPEELAELLSKQNNAGETPLYVAAEYGYVDVVAEIIKYHDVAIASMRAKNGYDALHIAARQGDVGMYKLQTPSSKLLPFCFLCKCFCSFMETDTLYIFFLYLQSNLLRL